ncbi:MAG: PDZ domain-containing protein [Candidatus Eremiobacteraeota bacterium]|nr:PDZ domain-containing protein [Candidatus Eremiobacteraeota bacterium]
MRRRVGMLFVTMALILFALSGCRAGTLSEDGQKKAAITVVLAQERAVQMYDFDKDDSLWMPDARHIEESYPYPREPALRQSFQPMKNAGIRIDYHPQDAVADVRDDVAWVTLTLHSVWKADTPQGRMVLGGSEWRSTYVESFVLLRTPEGWKIALSHTSMLPPDLGADWDYQQERPGVKFTEVSKGGPAGKAGFRSGDVLVAYGGQKIENADDLYRLRYAHYEGEHVLVTVVRGKEKITKEMTLEAMR